MENELNKFEEMIDNMKHTIGFDNRKVKGTKYRKYTCYRNFFTGSNKSLDSAVGLGLVAKRAIDREKWCASCCYSVTEKGFKYLSKLTGVEITKGEN